ncbi:hypothetical protein V2G26_013973 [Clonostachys chloroleuca]
MSKPLCVSEAFANANIKLGWFCSIQLLGFVALWCPNCLKPPLRVTWMARPVGAIFHPEMPTRKHYPAYFESMTSIVRLLRPNNSKRTSMSNIFKRYTRYMFQTCLL